jgi:hypothetical protein
MIMARSGRNTTGAGHDHEAVFPPAPGAALFTLPAAVFMIPRGFYIKNRSEPFVIMKLP